MPAGQPAGRRRHAHQLRHRREPLVPCGPPGVAAWPGWALAHHGAAPAQAVERPPHRRPVLQPEPVRTWLSGSPGSVPGLGGVRRCSRLVLNSWRLAGHGRSYEDGAGVPPPHRVDVCPLNPGAAGATAWRPARTSPWDRRTTPPGWPVVQTGGRRLSEHDAYLVRGDVVVRTPLASSSVAATRRTPQTAVARRPSRTRPTDRGRPNVPARPSPKSSRASTTASTSCQRSSGSSCGRPTRSEPCSTASCVVIRLAPFSSVRLALSEPPSCVVPVVCGAPSRPGRG